MAIKCNIKRSTTGIQYSDVHVVIGSFVEASKGLIVLTAAAWRSRQDYLEKMPAIDSFRFVIPVDDLVMQDNMRTTMYSYMMQQPEFENPIEDLNDDFPVTPI